MSLAAIASLETAARYGLKVLDEKINSSDDNVTTFAVVSRDKDNTTEGE
jgi:prephenate dehydratase